MPMRPLRFFTSVFTKLLGIIFLTGLGINLAIIFFLGGYKHHVAASYDLHLVRYIDYLLKDLGRPPNLEAARRIAADTGMIISYESPNRTWNTASAPIQPPPGISHTIYHKGPVRIEAHRGAHIVSVQQPGGRLLFYMPRQKAAEKKFKFLGVALLVLISLLLTGAYLAIRWVLKPLRWLQKGVDQVTHGRLTHRVPRKRADELGDLATSFNAMTERLGHLLKAKEHLLLDVSHELRSPITRIKVALAMLPDSHNKQGITEDLHEIEQKITELLKTARSLGAKAELQRQPTDLRQLIRLAAAPFENQPPGIRIALPSQFDPVAVDAGQMTKALRNLFDNAFKYSLPASQPVQVSLSAHTPALALIIIRDFGAGIPEEDIDLVFEPFYRADKSRSRQTGGFGLGLSLVRTIIEAHGGSIAIESKPGQGTTVFIYLPR